MDVHICKNENEAFRAPNGNLLVIPAWKPIPQQSQQQQPRTQMQQNPSILLGIPKILYGPVPQTFTQSITQTFARPLPQVTQQQLRYYNPY
ncbi:hypothetical protein GPJ56_002970 [Histomonas meleagridis]|uniref:uncharacterized protein n=1 Tax=Histomonas meleagridis TaxID=135588 RepID=UPI003559A0C7|nr:hypothetical protein GPJ56_002970 [Histomonas meleagridis]KAH0796630.1 hypothetical protein GO595_010523 [Histomonas meleagridis]